MKRFEFTPCPAIWIVYQDGRPIVWCTRKADAEKYRRWGKRKIKHHINIRRYELASSNAPRQVSTRSGDNLHAEVRQ
jgi:hypothetical protein